MSDVMDFDAPSVACDPAVPPVPTSIAVAICQIKQSLDAVRKSQKNQHGGYMFASTDDIYAALTKKMGEVGLICLGLEDQCKIVRVEKKDKNGNDTVSQWAHLVFSFVWAAKDGATWSHPRARRSLYIQVTGPQTFQAAQSYAEKAYLRSTFKLPTGDMDLDSMPQAETEEQQMALAGNGTKRKSSASAKRDGGSELFNEIRDKINRSIAPEMLQEIRNLYAEEWAAMPARWSDLLDQEYEARMDDLRANHA